VSHALAKTMTSEELYREVVRNPDDDAPRLAYADAVAPRDPARAEFIRLQIERFHDEAARGVHLGRPSAREAALRAKHGSRWGDAEVRYGRVPWLHLSPTSTPDRFHARTARPMR
jgi:uncharacterized protein (TIGR02996 family)